MLLRDLFERQCDDHQVLPTDYVQLPKVDKPTGKKRKKRWPTTDDPNNALIQNIWAMSNSDAV